MFRIYAGFCGLMLLCVGIGCSTSPQTDYASVELISAGGKITLDGEPLPEAVITFNTDDGQFSYGMTDDSGHYTLHFDSVKMGVTPGAKTIQISTTRKIPGLNTSEAGQGDDDPEAPKEKPKELVPEKYNRNSELKQEVTSDQTTYDFDLKSK